MKRFLLIIAFTFSLIGAFAQKKSKSAEHTKKDTTVAASKPAPTGDLSAQPIETYTLTMTKAQIQVLYNFIKDADNYSEKGRLKMWDDLAKLFVLVPPPPPPATTDPKK